MEQKSLLTYGIKGKLVSAICMLLVAAIMVVSSTYAWFTLSTAPEVTGISTTIGANGALEMALVTKDATGLTVYGDEGMATGSLKHDNGIWGNMVALSGGDTNNYGLNLVTLYPSLFKSANDALGNPVSFGNNAILAKPAYNATGRVTSADTAVGSAKLDESGESFIGDDDAMGVRAVGSASGLTDRQLAYRNAKANAVSFRSQAKNAAATSLKNNGSALASIAVKHAMSGGSETYAQSDIDALKNVVNGLLGSDASKVDGVLEYIEQAYVEYIVALAASAATGADAASDQVYLNVRALAKDKTFAQFIDALAPADGEAVFVLPTSLATAINSLKATRTTVESAKTALDTAAPANGTSYTWAEISVYLTTLANPSDMKVNGFPIGQVKEHMGDLVAAVSGGEGIKVYMPTGGGVYADVADHCGDYSAAVEIEEMEVGSLGTMYNLKARMITETTVSPVYLDVVSGAVATAGEPSASDGASMPVSEFYGYIVDLVFRTNAAGSNLLLQTEAVDRIYGDNTNADTMGSGSTMVFKSLSNDFTDEQVLNLIENFRIVFFTPSESGEGICDVLATAKLDVKNAKITADGVETPIVIYENRNAIARTCTYTYTAVVVNKDTGEETEISKDAKFTQYVYEKVVTPATTDESGVTTPAVVEYYTDYKFQNKIADITASDDAYVAAIKANLPADAKEGTAVTVGAYACDTTKLVVAETVLTGTDAIITALNQNVATPVSTLVYLDGESITNADVAAQAAASVTGTMNLQFASSAELVPMDYSDLHIAEQVNVNSPASLPEGVTFSGKTSTAKNKAYAFAFSGTNAENYTYTVKYTVAGVAGEKTLTSDDGINFVIPKEDVKGDITISVTTAAKTPAGE